MKNLLGGKGANLCEMAKIGLNVPPGMVITTEVCTAYYKHEGAPALPDDLMDNIREHVKLVEANMGQEFGSPNNPLLLSVRSGAAVSMPGMMDTVLNLGLNDVIVKGLAAARGDRFAYDCYRRLLQMFGDVVLGMPNEDFEECLTKMKKRVGAKYDIELSAENLVELVEEYKQVYIRHKKTIPEDPYEQLEMGIDAVSWNIPRAVKYREINKITGLSGTAVNLQTMVYGNINENSGTGVCFTRNPATGRKELFGEFLLNAQGEDVVAGTRTPLPIAQLADKMPAIYKELVDVTTDLESHMGDMQDIEFTVQDGRLFMLQTRNGKRTGLAALQVAVDLAKEGLVTSDKAVLLVEPRHLDQLLHPMFENEKGYAELVLAHGLAASPGAGVGRVVFTADDAEAWNARGEKVIMARTETSPEDVGGMHAAQGIITSRGGMTSHAAVVARGWGKPCVCGCEALQIDEHKKMMTVVENGTSTIIKEGDWISINGTTGEIITGQQALKPPSISGNLATLMKWVDDARRMSVMANVDTPEDNGAQGIGLCRTEHMFFSTPQRIAAVRRMIAATELESPEKTESLTELQGYQREDFEGIFRVIHGLPVTIRLLDPPLHEFLPHEGPALTGLCKQLAKELHKSSRLDSLRESNPMMGLRGCRLGIVHPEISEMQATAIFEAAANVMAEGKSVYPHIMIPLVSLSQELEFEVDLVHRAAKKVAERTGLEVPYKVGTMIEIPRGCLIAGQLAKRAEFFSFGTNDLTQMTFGISRDDAQAKFLTFYKKHGIIPIDPFETIDTEGVGEMVKIAVERGRATRPDLEIGICGEHGGDPSSIEFFDSVGLGYVSCSPLRVPIARLAAAQAAIKAKKQ
eukprot:gene27999-31095_t